MKKLLFLNLAAFGVKAAYLYESPNPQNVCHVLSSLNDIARNVGPYAANTVEKFINNYLGIPVKFDTSSIGFDYVNRFISQIWSVAEYGQLGKANHHICLDWERSEFIVCNSGNNSSSTTLAFNYQFDDEFKNINGCSPYDRSKTFSLGECHDLEGW